MTFKISSPKQRDEEYQKSITNPDKFWAEIAEEFTWFKKWEMVSNCDFKEARIEWFKGATTNLSYNCLDRHLATIPDQIALIHEPNDPQEKTQKITYKELHEKVCQFSNFLISRGIKSGDRVCIYMPMIPESAIAMLACARIGAVHCVVFAGFSAKALAGRIQDCGAKIIITADLLFRGEKKIELYEIVAEALKECISVEEVVVYRRKNSAPSAPSSSTLIWQDEVPKHSTKHEAVALDAEHPLFVLYTSGSTGKPKGLIHTTGGYMTYAGYSFQNVFQYEPGQIFFCSADIGWITGHSYLIYGPLLCGATSLMFEGIPTHPTASRFWEVIEKHQVNIFYTAPTAIRSLMQKGDEFVNEFKMSSLTTLGTVGEPINHEAWQWYFEKVGKKKCPISDTWWQTETGGILISSLAGVTESRATFAGLPLPGIVPTLLDEEGMEIVESDKTGNLCFKQAWPGLARGIWGDHQKFYQTYFATFLGYYFAGDGAFRSADGLFRIIGRVDDVIKISGHRLGTAEIENAINMHEQVSESSVIGYPHEIKGEGIYAFIIRKKAFTDDQKKLKNEITLLIQKEIGAIAKPDKIYIVDDLPKTRSGKIMRRILKKIVAGEKDFGDISTLVNPELLSCLDLKDCS